MKNFIKNHTKIFVCLCLVAVVLCGLGFDYARSKTFKLEVESITPENPVADNRQPVEIVITLTRFGKPIEGHTLYLLPQNGGSMVKNVVKTDEKGRATFTYNPYSETFLMKAQPVTFYCHDESNSIFFEINANITFVINLRSKND